MLLDSSKSSPERIQSCGAAESELLAFRGPRSKHRAFHRRVPPLVWNPGMPAFVAEDIRGSSRNELLQSMAPNPNPNRIAIYANPALNPEPINPIHVCPFTRFVLAMDVELDPSLLHSRRWLIICIGAQALVVGRLMWLSRLHWGAIKGLLGSLGLALTCKRFKTASAEDRLLQAKVAAMRLRISHKMNHVCLFGWAVAVCTVEFNILTGSPRWMSAQLSWLCLATFMWHVLPFVFPSMLRESTVKWWYVVVMCLSLLIESPWATTVDQSLHLFLVTHVFMQLPGIIFAPPWLLAVGNTASWAQATWRSIHEERNRVACSFTDRPLNAIFVDSLSFMIILAGAFAVRKLLNNHVRQKFLITQANTELSAASSLLHLTCDAVLELDEDLKLVTQSGLSLLFAGGVRPSHFPSPRSYMAS